MHTREANLLCAKLLCETYGNTRVWIAFVPVWRMAVASLADKRT
jgi:hypothetical protein